MQADKGRVLVNPVSMRESYAKVGDQAARVLDISYIRAVVEAVAPFSEVPEGELVRVQFEMDRSRFALEVTVRGKGADWVRLDFPALVPSVRAHLRSFLSARKIGESIVEDWRSGALRHYHGLNESELWTDDADAVLFTYLDPEQPDSQFLIRVREARGPLAVGRISRKEYMELSSIDAPIHLKPLPDSEVYRKLGECRDIVTNFRPSLPEEYTLKSRMLKIISETLYSTSRRVEMLPSRTVTQPVRTEGDPGPV